MKNNQISLTLVGQYMNRPRTKQLRTNSSF